MPDESRFPWHHDGDTLVLETPEQTSIEVPIAPFTTRVVAAALDRLVILAFSVVIFLGGLLGLYAAGLHEHVGYVVAVLVAVWFLFTVFYYTWGELRGDGRTWGKRRMGIRTVMETGQGVTFGAAVVRNLCRVVDELPVFWVVPAVSRGGRRLGDYLAGTVVVVERKSPRRRRVAPAPIERQFQLTAGMAQHLRAEDLDLLEYLHEQLATALPGRRRALASAIAAKYVTRLGLEAEQERVAADPLAFLVELEAFLRERFEERAY